LIDITWAINCQTYSTTGLLPIDIVFRQHALPAKFLTTIQQKSLPGILNKDGTYTTDQEVVQLFREAEVEERECNVPSEPRNESEAQGDDDAVADQLLEEFIDTTQLAVNSSASRNQTLLAGPSARLEYSTNESSDNGSSYKSDRSDIPADFQGDLQMPIQLSDDENTNTSNNPILQKALRNTIKAREKMSAKYAKAHQIEEFVAGDIVAVKLPRGTRTSTDPKRIFAKVLAMPKKDRYKIQTK
jgi:hypothetical protein